MSKVVAVATLLAFVLLAGTDAFSCADGCTSSADHPAPTESVPRQAPNTCVMCVLGVELTAVLTGNPPSVIVTTPLPPVGSPLPVGVPFSLDHPPRLA